MRSRDATEFFHTWRARGLGLIADTHALIRLEDWQRTYAGGWSRQKRSEHRRQAQLQRWADRQ